MSGRTVRARPVDVHKQLDIVKDPSLLDSLEGLPTVPVPTAPEPEKPKQAIQEPHQPGKEIPIPGVTIVPTYAIDYLPTFRERNTYIRGKGGDGYHDPTYVEYDLDSEDERWLEEFNGDQERLSVHKFEMMLWKLDVHNAEATDRVLTLSGCQPAERYTHFACSTTDNLTKEEALQMLEERCPTRESIATVVYDYWMAKRLRLDRPLLRRLQAPTPINDQNPYRVFRPREKIHRPQTRRRRENNEDSLEKLRMIRANLHAAADLFQLVAKRERKKRDMLYVMTDWQQLQIKQRHEPRGSQDAIEAEYQAAAKVKNPKRPIGFDHLPEAAPAATNALLDFKNKKSNKKRKIRLGVEPQLNAVANLPPPPLPPQTGMPYATELDVTQIESMTSQPLETVRVHGRSVRPRFGRGGRLIFDRCQAFTLQPLTPGPSEEDGMKHINEMPNPYSQWLNKSDLSSGPAQTSVVKIRVTGTTPSLPAATAAIDQVTPKPEPQ